MINPNLAMLNELNDGREYYKQFGQMYLMLVHLSQHVDAEVWQQAITAGCQYGLGPSTVKMPILVKGAHA